MIKKITLLSSSIIGISIIITLWTSPPFYLMAFWDILFTLSLLLTLIGSGLFISYIGLFHPFISNFKYFLQKINPVQQMADQVEQKNQYDPHFTSKPHPFMVPTIVTGAILTIFASVFSIIL